MPKYTMPMNWHYTVHTGINTGILFAGIIKISLIWNFPLYQHAGAGAGEKCIARGRWRSMNWL